MGLSFRQSLFVAYYLDEAFSNATKAALMAGYAHPHVAGTRLLDNVKVRAALDAHLATVMPAKEVLARISRLATASLDDFLDIPDGTTDDPDFNLAKGKRRGKIGNIKRLKRTRREIFAGEHNPPEVETKVEIEIHDAHKGLDMLAKVHGLYKAPIVPPDERKPRIEIPRRDERSDAG